MLKNVAGQKWRVFAFNTTTGAKVTGDAANITAKLSKDHGTLSAVTDTNPTETEDGYYLFDVSQTETNANVLALYPESATPNVQVIGDPPSIFTRPANFQLLAIDASGRTTDAKLKKYVQLLTRKDAGVESDLSTELAEINADTGSGSGNYSSQTDSLEAVRDRGDTAWLTGAASTPPTTDAIAAAVWNKATTSHTTAGTFGKAVGDILTACNNVVGKFSGITKLAGWLRLMTRSDAAVKTDHATELLEINENVSSGAGDYDPEAKSLEAIGDYAAAAASLSAVRFHINYDPEGDKLQVVCWLEVNGLVADLSSDAGVELDLSITEFGAATPLVEFDADSTDLEGDKFQLEQLEPNPSAGRAYDLVATLTFDGTAYAGGSAFSIWGS